MTHFMHVHVQERSTSVLCSRPLHHGHCLDYYCEERKTRCRVGRTAFNFRVVDRSLIIMPCLTMLLVIDEWEQVYASKEA
jgi:hypothetical protein